jgi:DNA replication protein DnaC
VAASTTSNAPPRINPNQTNRRKPMLHEPTKTKLYAMKLNGMAQAYDEQRAQPRNAELSFDERFGMLVERQWLWRENRALASRLVQADLKQSACIEDLDFRLARGLKRPLIEQLSGCDWVTHHQNIIITGPTGCGKTFIACAIAHKACREGHRVLYFYAPKLWRAFSEAMADGSLSKLLKKIAKVPVLVIDDWGLIKLNERQCREFLEILDDRHGHGCTVITSQLPVSAWHEAVPDPTVADALLDRLIHNAHRLELKGESLRKPPASV